MISKIVSGGQAGVDRAALDWAIANDVPHGGWCPAGRRAEDGPLLGVHLLKETEGKGYRARTTRNVRDSEATLILNVDVLEGGSLETRRIAERFEKPVLVVQLDDGVADAADVARAWLDPSGVRVLNVAGPRESKRPGIYRVAYALLSAAMSTRK